MKNVQRTVLFERINVLNVFLAIFFASRGCAVYYLELWSPIARNTFFLKLFKKFKIKRPITHYSHAVHELAIKISDEQRERFRAHPFARVISKSFGTDELYLPFKKQFTERICDYLDLIDIAGNLSLESEEREVLVFPERIPREMDRSAELFNAVRKPNIRTSPAASMLAALNGATEWLESIARLSSFPFWLMRNVAISRFDRQGPRRFKNCIRVFGTEWTLNHERGVELWFDGKSITKQNTIFYLDYGTSKELEREFDKLGYSYFHLKDMAKAVNPGFSTRVIFRVVLPVWWRCWIRSVLEPAMFSSTAFLILKTYVYWNAFLENYQIENLIAFSDATMSAMVRNSLLKASQVRCILYDHSAAFADVLTPLDRPMQKHILYLDQNYSDYVCWGEKNKRYYIENGCRPGKFYIAGCLWSEHVAKADIAQVEALKKELVRSVGPLEGKKIVSVFDTSAGGNAILTTQDMRKFIFDVHRAVTELPEAVMVLKLKKNLQVMMEETLDPEIVRVYHELQGSPGICILEDSHITPSLVLALSDLAIAACYTSPATEALGAKKKVIYYDATARFRNTYFDQFPKLVAHSYDELTQFMHYWLYEMNQDDFEAYLKQWIVGELDGFCDGQGITRARKYIAGEV